MEAIRVVGILNICPSFGTFSKCKNSSEGATKLFVLKFVERPLINALACYFSNIEFLFWPSIYLLLLISYLIVSI